MKKCDRAILITRHALDPFRSTDAILIVHMNFLGTDETYPVKNGSYVMRCISFIGVLFVCPPSSTYLCGGRIAICVPTAILISPKLPVRIPGMKVSIAAIAEA